jgi:hypothetical protein
MIFGVARAGGHITRSLSHPRDHDRGAGLGAAWPSSVARQQTGLSAPTGSKNDRSRARTGTADVPCFQRVISLFFLCYLLLKKLSKSPIFLSDCPFLVQEDLAAIMHHASRFCLPGRRTHAVDPFLWIGVRQLAVQRIGD